MVLSKLGTTHNNYQAVIHFMHISQYVTGRRWFPDVLHCHDVEAVCLDFLIIFAMVIKACYIFQQGMLKAVILKVQKKY